MEKMEKMKRNKQLPIPGTPVRVCAADAERLPPRPATDSNCNPAPGATDSHAPSTGTVPRVKIAGVRRTLTGTTSGPAT